jgi:subtilisin family serine protease
MNRFAIVALCALLALSSGTISAAIAQTAAPPSPAASGAAKKLVTSAADLLRFTYPVSGTVSDLITGDDATFNAFAAKVRSDIESVLASYDIQDHGTLRGLLTVKADLQLMSGTEDAAAVQTIAQIRALEDKPDSRLLSGLLNNAVIAARAATGSSSGDAYNAAMAKFYAAAIAPLPWSVVGTTLKEAKTSFDVVTPALLDGQLAAELDPAVAKSHELSDAAAALVIRTRYYVRVLVPSKDQVSAVLGAEIAQNSVQKPDIWAARDVTLQATDKLTPVRIAVWDSGSDVSLFPHQLFTDPHPGPYDPHGLGFDLLSFPAHGPLMPLTPAQRKMFPSEIAFLEGYSDLIQSIDSPAATRVKKQLQSLAQADVATFFANLEVASQYSHGTHVAGIALRGNPAARLVVVRLTYDAKLIPTPPTEASEHRAAASEMTDANYLRSRHVRVVNMSWGGSPGDDESVLEKNGIGKDATERKALAAKYFAIDRAGLYAAIKSAPGVLFVCSAGNSNGDAGFSETIPAGFDLPNLLVVGAVDQAGDETSFTSYGKTVSVDADGYEVESVVPGGAHVRQSGTSMAAPNVANLAAKLIALDPKLTPEQTIALIRKGATPSSDGRRFNINPKASVALLRAQLAVR